METYSRYLRHPDCVSVDDVLTGVLSVVLVAGIPLHLPRPSHGFFFVWSYELSHELSYESSSPVAGLFVLGVHCLLEMVSGSVLCGERRGLGAAKHAIES